MSSIESHMSVDTARSSESNMTIGTPTSPSPLVNQMIRIMDQIVQHTGDNGRTPAQAFLELPSGIDIKKIRNNINSEVYHSLDDLAEDFLLMCRNAQTDNAEESPIYEDSIALQVVFKELRENEEAENVMDVSDGGDDLQFAEDGDDMEVNEG